MRRTIFFPCVLPLLLAPVQAQTTFGSISGVVKDQTGATVPGATVKAVNEGTGSERQTTTQNGVYHLSDLAAGFQPHRTQGLILNADQTFGVDVVLGVSGTTTEIQVAATAAAVDTETSTLSYVKTHKDLEQLPLVARSSGDFGFYGYTIFNPGVSKVAGQSNPAVNGMRILDTVPTIDGIAVMAYLDGIGAARYNPVSKGSSRSTSNSRMRKPNSPRPGNFTVVTKSGTNDFHGGAYWDYNGDHLNARSFFAASTPFRAYNDFAGSFGGPIRKNKTFFFGDYEGSRESARTVLVGNTPLVPWRSGDFTGLNRSITDPTTGAAFPGNRIPSTRLNPVSLTRHRISSIRFPSSGRRISNPATGADSASARTDSLISTITTFVSITIFARKTPSSAGSVGGGCPSPCTKTRCPLWENEINCVTRATR